MSLSAGAKPPRAILFDWDNTLVNTWPTIVECYRDTFVALGREPWTAQQVQDFAHGSLRDLFPSLFGPRAGEAEKVFYETFDRIHLERLQPLPDADVVRQVRPRRDVHIPVPDNGQGLRVARLEQCAQSALDECFPARVPGPRDLQDCLRVVLRDVVEVVADGSPDIF